MSDSWELECEWQLGARVTVGSWSVSDSWGLECE